MADAGVLLEVLSYFLATLSPRPCLCSLKLMYVYEIHALLLLSRHVSRERALSSRDRVMDERKPNAEDAGANIKGF